jgi:hypothetical protein
MENQVNNLEVLLGNTPEETVIKERIITELKDRVQNMNLSKVTLDELLTNCRIYANDLREQFIVKSEFDSKTFQTEFCYAQYK